MNYQQNKLLEFQNELKDLQMKAFTVKAKKKKKRINKQNYTQSQSMYLPTIESTGKKWLNPNSKKGSKNIEFFTKKIEQMNNNLEIMKTQVEVENQVHRKLQRQIFRQEQKLKNKKQRREKNASEVKSPYNQLPFMPPPFNYMQMYNPYQMMPPYPAYNQHQIIYNVPQAMTMPLQNGNSQIITTPPQYQHTQNYRYNPNQYPNQPPNQFPNQYPNQPPNQYPNQYPNQNRAPPQMRNHQLNRTRNIGGQINPKLDGKKLLRKFRVAAYAVYFIKMYTRLGYNLTKFRFDKFKSSIDNFENERKQFHESLKQSLLEQSFKHQKFNDLDQINEVKDEEATQKTISEDNMQINFFMKLKNSLNFLKNLIKAMKTVFENSSIIEENKFLRMFFPKNFIYDNVINEQDFRFVNLHSRKGYSRHTNNVGDHLIFKFILNQIFQYNLLIDLGIMHYQQKIKKDAQNKNRIVFSFHIRQIILKLLSKNYFQKQTKAMSIFPFPSEAVHPYFLPLHTSKKKRNYFFGKSKILLSEEQIIETMKGDLEKCQKQFFADLKTIQNKIQKFFKPIFLKEFKEDKDTVLKQKLKKPMRLAEELQYYARHTEEELEQNNEKNKKIIQEEEKDNDDDEDEEYQDDEDDEEDEDEDKDNSDDQESSSQQSSQDDSSSDELSGKNTKGNKKSQSSSSDSSESSKPVKKRKR